MTVNKNIYAQMLSEVVPQVIETEEENNRILKVIDNLMKKGEGKMSPEEERLFLLLTKLVEDFEDKTYPMPENTDPLGTMLFLMEQNDLKQADMIDVFGSSGRVSDVINGKRGISKTHARKLADKFNVPADLFI